MKKILLFALVLAFVFGIAGVVLAENKVTSAPPAGQEIKERLKINATTTPAKPQINIVCIQNSVDRRESAIIIAFEKKSAAIKSALETRKADLKSAWALTALKDRIKARWDAWNKFRKAVDGIKKVYKEEINAAWKNFEKERKNCNAPSEGGENQGTDYTL
jgi:hypothetical protein